MTEKSKVYFTPFSSDFQNPFSGKIKRLLLEAGLGDIVKSGQFVGVKCHFGERGNHAFISPIYVRMVVDAIREFSSRVFLTDTSTLYMGSRGHAVSYIETAHLNGFLPGVVGAPVIIADGLRGYNGEEVEINGKHYKQVEIAKAIFEMDAMVVVSHFKGHELTGFGGAIKNIGMGCATKKGKLSMHSKVRPSVVSERCDGCKICIKWCPVDSIEIVDGVAVIDEKSCIGCAECITACPVGAVSISWDSASTNTQERMTEHALGVIKALEGKLIFINFLNNISPACDCYPSNAPPIVNDIGVLSSSDIIAVDRASYDLVSEMEGINYLAGFGEGEDKFRALYGDVSSTLQIEYGEKLGMGHRIYDIMEI